MSSKCEQILHHEEIGIANKYVEKCSLLLIFRKIQIKTQWDTTAYVLGWLKEKIPAISSFSEDTEQLKLSYIAGGIAKLYSHFAKHFVSFL